MSQYYPPAVHRKAEKLEQLLLRLEAGEPLEKVCAELELPVSRQRVEKLKAKYEAGGRERAALLDGRFGHYQQVNTAVRAYLYERKQQDEQLTAGQLAGEVAAKFGVSVSEGHINHVLRQVALTRPPGRPGPSQVARSNCRKRMPGFFSLEGAKQAMGVTPVVMMSLTEAEAQRTVEQPEAHSLLWEREAETRWHKLDHLLYLPVLGLTRPRDLYYYQGQGLQVLYGFTYKYLPLEHFLGRLSRLGVSQGLALSLAACYSQAWYPGVEALDLFVDWHIKPHWTKQAAQSGHITMWGRVMPGTKQLIVNGPGGHLLGGWNEAIDTHLSRVLVELELKLEAGLQRPIRCLICDSEGGGLPTGQRYAEAKRYYLSLLPRQSYSLSDFVLQEAWQPVSGDPAREVALAQWREPAKAAEEVRDLVLMRRLSEPELSRIYAGRLPPALGVSDVPALYRQRWAGQERVIRELVNGANLNANFGYSYQEVPNRTRQRQWTEAQAKVEVSEHRLAQHQAALANLRQQLLKLRQSYAQARQALQTALAGRQVEFLARHQAGQPLRRCQQRLAALFGDLDTLTARYRRRRRRLCQQLRLHRTQQAQVKADLLARQTARDQLDTASLCHQRELAKDQLMVNLQVLLANLHDWTRTHYLAPAWRHLELERAIELIYRKPGVVRWAEQEIEVILEPYRYPEQQRAMEETCRRFNAAQLLWRDGRRLRIRVAPAG